MTLTGKDITQREDPKNELAAKIDLGTDLDSLSSAVERALQGADQVLAEAEKASWRVKRNAEDSAQRQLEKLRAKQKVQVEPQLPEQAPSGPKEVDMPYTHLMELCADAARKGSAGRPEGMRVLKEMESLGIMPNSATYTSLMNVLAQAASHKKAKMKDGFKVLSEMKDRGLAPTVITYTTLLALIVRACDNGEPVQLKDGFSVLDEMEARQVQPERFVMATLMALVAKLVKRGRASIADAEALMARAAELKAVDATTYNNLLCAYGNALNATWGSISDGYQVLYGSRSTKRRESTCSASRLGRDAALPCGDALSCSHASPCSAEFSTHRSRASWYLLATLRRMPLAPNPSRASTRARTSVSWRGFCGTRGGGRGQGGGGCGAGDAGRAGAGPDAERWGAAGPLHLLHPPRHVLHRHPARQGEHASSPAPTVLG